MAPLLLLMTMQHNKNTLIEARQEPLVRPCSQPFYKAIAPYFLLFLLCALLYLPGITKIPVIDRDSAHFAQATRQMLETGHFFQIRFQEKTRFQKPPGINWLQAFFVQIVSTPASNEIWPYRIPSFLGGLFAVLASFAFAKRFLGASIAFLGATLLALSFLLTIEAHMAVIDPALLCATVLMQGALWQIYIKTLEGEKPAIGWAALFWGAMSFGFLLKGLTPWIAGLTLLALILWDRKWQFRKALYLPYGLLFFLLSSGLWLFFVSRAEGQNYLSAMFQKDLLPKLISGHESHGMPLGFHSLLLPITFWPGSLFLYHTLKYTWQTKAHPSIKFLCAWCVPLFLFFELMPTKLPQYVLPAFPALSILTACAMLRFEKEQPPFTRLLKILTLLWGILSLSIAACVLIIPTKLMGDPPWVSYFIFAIFTLGTLASLYFFRHKKMQKSLLCLILGSLISLPLFYQYFLPSLEPLWLSKRVAQATTPFTPQYINNTHPLLVIGFGEPSLVFTLGTHQVKYVRIEEALHALLEKKSYMILIRDHSEKILLKKAAAFHIKLILQNTIHGFNYSKGQWRTLFLFQNI